MAENQDLLKTVIEDPDNNDPRYEYANWCEQQDGSAIKARAAFIRLQIKLNALNGNTNGPGWFYLKNESDKCVEQYGSQWAKGVPTEMGHYAFHRGFVDFVRLGAAQFLEVAQTLFETAPIQHLDLYDIEDAAHQLRNCHYLTKVRSLSLRGCGLNDTNISFLAASEHLGRLRWLSLEDNQIGFKGAETLAASKTLNELRYVDLTGNEIEPCEQYSHDQGVIVDKWLPESGQRLEQLHGPIPWLHLEAMTVSELPPYRFA